MITFTNVRKTFGDTVALDSVTTQFDASKVTALVGPNGAGKSTLLKLLMRRIHPDKGSISGVESIGFCPQQDSVWDDLTTTEQISMFCKLQNASPTNVQRVIDLLTLHDVSDRLVKDLSGGFRKRVSIAMAIVHDPAVIVLDEPEIGLDPPSRKTVREFCRNCADEGKSVVVATHEIDTLKHFVDHVVILASGNVRADRPLSDFNDLVSEFSKLTQTKNGDDVLFSSTIEPPEFTT